MKYADWVPKENLIPLLEFLSELLKYDFDNMDQDAILAGIKTTDAEAGHWFDYQFQGFRSLALRIGEDPGTGILRVQIECPKGTEVQVQTAVEMAKTFDLTRSNTRA